MKWVLFILIMLTYLYFILLALHMTCADVLPLSYSRMGSIYPQGAVICNKR